MMLSKRLVHWMLLCGLMTTSYALIAQQPTSAFSKAAQAAQAERQAELNLQISQAQQTVQQSMFQAQQNPLTPMTSAPTSSSASAPTTCNCYENTDPDNSIPNNFYFNSAGVRIGRINPACQCLPAPKSTTPTNTSTSSIVNTPAPASTTQNTGSNNAGNNDSTKTNANTPTNESGSSSGFNIQYN